MERGHMAKQVKKWNTKNNQIKGMNKRKGAITTETNRKQLARWQIPT